MLLILSIIVMYNRALMIDSAPKLGHINFDPLSNEAKFPEMSLKDIIFSLMNKHYNTSAPEQEKVLNTSPKFKFRRADGVNSNQTHCTGYDYNDTICKTVDDRVICGYNKNIGEVQNESVEVGNGCRIRGDRLECGYLKGPFNNTRRPPVSDEEESESEENNKKLRYTVDLKSTSWRKKSNTLTTPPTTVMNLTSTKNNKSYQNTSHVTKTHFISSSTTNKPMVIKKEKVTKRKKRCVEKNDRIFCYENKS
ncbi:uncharacterized protein LOC133320253 isoform X1 [Danaus plexippus]|uniref:uncharacterized protein LOC133320253 isoform X1 n=2 Tax=Danaus plexippus TaxID=13037 RepID=UPI002AB00FB2|nr:uncharacterized protein LOC133320253 isoform X1 [Danaus plexippus]